MKIADELIQALRAAQSIVVLTGAGTSAESGVPTFRDAQTGLWARYDPTQLATPEAFQRDPKLVWEWYQWRRELVAKAEPNAGHYALVELQDKVPQLHLITQNVDGMHQRAGSRDVIELHGNIMRTRCAAKGHIVSTWQDTKVPPRCDGCNCNGYLRPDVVWFGESLPMFALQKAEQVAAQCDVLLSVGTSGLVYPAAGLPDIALQEGATVVEINPQATPLTTRASYALQTTSAVALPALLTAVWG